MCPAASNFRAAALVVLLASLLAPGLAHAEDTGPPDLTGLWAKEYTLTSTYTIARIARFTTTSQTYLLARLTQNGSSLRMQTQVCGVELGNTAPGFRPVIPDAFVESLGEGDIRASLMRQDGTWTFHTPRIWNMQGIEMEDPAREKMPTSCEDPRVFDQEGDGHKGFTVDVQGPFGGSLYLARRGWEQFTGTIAGDRIDGTVQWDADEVVLDATRRILRTSPETIPDLSRSTFRMVPIDEDATCATLMARRHTYFPDPS